MATSSYNWKELNVYMSAMQIQMQYKQKMIVCYNKYVGDRPHSNPNKEEQLNFFVK